MTQALLLLQSCIEWIHPQWEGQSQKAREPLRERPECAEGTSKWSVWNPVNCTQVLKLDIRKRELNKVLQQEGSLSCVPVFEALACSDSGSAAHPAISWHWCCSKPAFKCKLFKALLMQLFHSVPFTALVDWFEVLRKDSLCSWFG